MNNEQLEKLEVLDGSRRGNRDKAAVRIEDLRELLQINGKLRSAQLTAAPTMADFNVLQKDIEDLSNRLYGVASAIQKRLIR
ncbi:hypothetical protein [Agrobacterium tumefaciens]|uniref:hypothetical protein n=1 Tax=Agrobacterium tumefaciens TaxID=358 RepID=UPI0006187AA0|nr:hypothetical protein [Agrobacterium tumefaciens]AKC07180.1 hypothetical protein Ach5_14040 [Agrobacterium tumefaciens]AYM67321.1 hypothetical protein AtA6_11040 [Agrobacterium tumefaciens]NIB54914.1 hypothetical protein [Agrobacterium tumefaciens]NSZ21631.1 hypothetical protein [Agrobacterium tumefaciens]QQE32527.1 hypothetical protein I6I05_11265 [Agrobacterium tumefaciens]